MKVILLDNYGKFIGEREKLAAHRNGELHLAFSIFIFDSRGRMLLQKREYSKYHSGGLWTNTCCSHPSPGQKIIDSAHNRLKYEMGVDCSLCHIGNFTYKAELNNGLTEHETDYIFIGFTDQLPAPHPEEVADFRYSYINEVKTDMNKNPEVYTEWFKIIMEKFGKELETKIKVHGY